MGNKYAEEYAKVQAKGESECRGKRYTVKPLLSGHSLLSDVSKLWGGSRGGSGSGGSVEPPKLNVKMYNKHVVKKEVNQLS